ncbi:transketolase C-terminal domain-containing protein [Oscillospiraceae bacterium MB08-C2-2]|nr:transketolase C-terminal domain-containing protein [Oscillospiraceae bacterium MB08-C2-2]
MEMRQVYGSEMEKIMSQNPKVCTIDADLARANGTWDLRNKFPDRALDVGIAEPNMAGVAAGLSSYGFIPFISTFASFAARKIADQIYVSMAYAKQNVKVVGTDPGISAELNGGTHMPFEDIGTLRSIPTLVIYEPADNEQLRQALPQIVDHYGPVYIRMNRKVVPDVFGPDYKFDLFKADVISEGSDVSLLCTGVLVSEAIKAAAILKEKGISAEVINVHTIKPLDEETVLASAKKTNHVVTCENHNVIGGLYSAVAELLSEKYPCKMGKIGAYDRFGEVGVYPELIKHFHMTADDIVAKVLEGR